MFNRLSFDFLQTLSVNNNKKWFIAHSDQYQERLVEPCKELIQRLRTFILTVDENLETNAVVNKSITTIYRDLRYSKNRLPFKDHMGINFRKKTSEWKKHPAFFFRIRPSGYYFGLMVMKNNPEHFEAFRKAIERNPKAFKNIIKKIDKNNDITVIGDEYKKFSYPGKDKLLNNYYCKKNLYILCHRDSNHFTDYDEMTTEITDLYHDLLDLYFFLQESFLAVEKAYH